MVTEQVLKDVEEARMMVVSYKREKIELQIARASITIRRMRRSRMWRKLISKLEVHCIQLAINNEPPNSDRGYVDHFLLKKYGHSDSYIKSKAILKYARKVQTLAAASTTSLDDYDTDE